MSKSLIIAEKPSVATDLARVLGKLPEIGKFKKEKNHYENEKVLITSAVGHLVELKMPTLPNGKKLPWGFKHLPIIPDHFELQPIERSQDRLKAVVRLLKNKDVTEIVNACDAGREGELIFHYLLDLSGVKKPVKRMWMQSMTDNSILDAYRNLRTGEDMKSLADAAVCRSESDWLIGLNGTRALTAYNSRHGGFNVTTAGRVQTPTLTILAERELEIRSFVPSDYWEVHGEFKVEAGEYPGKWFREDFKKDPAKEHGRAERIWSEAEARAIIERCEGRTGVVEEKKKPSKQAPPLLYDLTTLQREAGTRFGFSAKRTLQLAQALYEKYKALTYPRTDSRYLPQDYLSTVKGTMKSLSQARDSIAIASEVTKYSADAIANNRVQLSGRIFDDKKVSDHFAIIPTGKIPVNSIDEGAQKLYDMVTRRFIAVFFPPAEFEITKRITRIGDDSFKTDGRILVSPGWLGVYGRVAGAAAEKDELVPAKDGEDAKNTSIELKSEQTRPPARYTESTLLSAMETAGKRVDDEDLREAMSERGLGTPATRAAIIEGLISQKYLLRDERSKRDLVVSSKGLNLIKQLREIGIKTLGSPEMTGEWEHKLKQMEQGQLDRNTFMKEVETLARRIVEKTLHVTDELANRSFPDLQAICPKCGSDPIKQTDGTFECKNPECDLKVKKYIASHELTEAQAKELLEKKFVGPIDGFKSRFGKDFSAGLELDEKFKVGFVFEGDGEKQEEIKNLTEEQVICEVELPGTGKKMAKVYETESAYLAPDMGNKADKNGTRISKTILQREIPREQALKLFTDKKTDLLPDFISKKGRKFSAHLTLDPVTGKIGWEFAPREPKKKAASKKKAAAKKSTAAK